MPSIRIHVTHGMMCVWLTCHSNGDGDATECKVRHWAGTDIKKWSRENYYYEGLMDKKWGEREGD